MSVWWVRINLAWMLMRVVNWLSPGAYQLYTLDSLSRMLRLAYLDGRGFGHHRNIKREADQLDLWFKYR